MKTSYWSGYRGPGRIRICVGVPRWLKRTDYESFLALAPTRKMLALDKGEYLAQFHAQLDKLCPRVIWNALHNLVPGTEPVLMCFERPPFTEDNWCHRRIVAEWFEQAIHEPVDELTPPTPPESKQRALF